MDTDHCPICDAKAVVVGHFLQRGGFEPKGMRFFNFRLRWWAVAYTAPLRACLTCGHVWTHLQPEELRTFIEKNGTEKAKLKLAPFMKRIPEQDLV
jgi:hypothetical protein